jgi:hypothetical protein
MTGRRQGMGIAAAVVQQCPRGQDTEHRAATPEHLYWPDLNVDLNLAVESIEHPGRAALCRWRDAQAGGRVGVR